MDFDCYSTFVENIEEVNILAEAAEKAFEISSKRAPEVTAEEATRARRQGNATTRAALVLLCGYLEGLVRDIAEEYVDLLNDEDFAVGSYPEDLFRSIMLDLADGLRLRTSNSVTAFKKVIEEGRHPPINKKKFSKTGGNPTVETIETVFSSMGIPDVIDKLSVADYGVESTYINESQVQPALRNAIVEKIGGRPELAGIAEQVIGLIDGKWLPLRKRRKVGYVNEIEQLLKRRNRIAHGEGNEQVTTTELRASIDFVLKLANGLHGLAKASYTGLCAAKA